VLEHPPGIISLDDEAEFDEVLNAPLAVLYKYSSRCWISARASGQVQRFAEEYPQVPIYSVDVIFQQELSNRIAEKLRIAHQSPQLIILRDGAATWHGSHFSVSHRSLLANTQ
jgi:bacillithiol system protein YtxJ